MGAVLAVAPAFSGVALFAVLVVSALVGALLLAAPYPPKAAIARPVWKVLRWWLVWAGAVIALESVVLLAADELRWPPLSAIQDPLTTSNPVGRFVAGAAWAATGHGLVVLSKRYPGDATGHARAGAGLVCATLLLLAVRSVARGPMLLPRDAPTVQAPGVDNTPMGSWPVTTWVTIGAFLALIAGAYRLHRLGRAADPPSAVPDLFAWLMASWLARILIYLLWVWCGWHFLAR